MDVFLEYMIKRKKGPKEIVADVLIILAAAAFIVVVLPNLAVLVPFLQSFVLLLAAGAVYAAYRLIASHNVEYEYIITNGEMDIDKIIAKRQRRRVLSVSCRKFEIVAPLHGPQSKPEYADLKTIDAAKSADSPTAYFGIYMGEGGRTRVIFEASPAMLRAFKSIIPQKVFINGET